MPPSPSELFPALFKLSGMTGCPYRGGGICRHIQSGCCGDSHQQAFKAHRPSDVVYKNENGKYRAIIAQIGDCHKGSPFWWAPCPSKSELLSSLLKKRGIPHNVLNAKHHEREAEIVAQAGKFGAVTIATNGRARHRHHAGRKSGIHGQNDLRKAGFSKSFPRRPATPTPGRVLKARSMFAEAGGHKR